MRLMFLRLMSLSRKTPEFSPELGISREPIYPTASDQRKIGEGLSLQHLLARLLRHWDYSQPLLHPALLSLFSSHVECRRYISWAVPGESVAGANTCSYSNVAPSSALHWRETFRMVGTSLGQRNCSNAIPYRLWVGRHPETGQGDCHLNTLLVGPDSTLGTSTLLLRHILQSLVHDLPDSGIALLIDQITISRQNEV
jgi:hypothetical protein